MMKILVGLMLIATVCIAGQAQTQEGKVIADLASSGERVVKNAPFSADAVSESVQTLADGNRIVHSLTTKFYRNSEGRSRRDIVNNSGGLMGSVLSVGGAGTTIMDPIAGQRYYLDTSGKTVYQVFLAPTVVKDNTEMTPEQRAEIERAKAKSVAGLAAGSTKLVIRSGDGQNVGGALTRVSTDSKYETRTEQLGVQNIEGVDAEGTRQTTTIPAGAIGNERPIEIVYERWYSKDLQLVVMSKHSDPRIGDQSYRLTNINRSEPDPSLFNVPSGYKVITEPGGVYKIDADKVQIEKAAGIKVVRPVGAAAKPLP